MSSTPSLNAVGASTPFPIKRVNVGAASPLPPSVICGLSAGGSLTYNVEVTGAAIDSLTNQFPNDNWAPLSGATGLTGSAAVGLPMQCTGVRVNVTSCTSGSLSVTVTQ